MSAEHSSEIRGLRSTKCFSETLQNLLFYMYKKIHLVFFVFHFVQLYIFTLWMPWSMSTIDIDQGIHLGEKIGHFIKHKHLISEDWGSLKGAWEVKKKFNVNLWNIIENDPSEIRCLCLMKWPGWNASNLPYVFYISI